MPPATLTGVSGAAWASIARSPPQQLRAVADENERDHRAPPEPGGSALSGRGRATTEGRLCACMSLGRADRRAVAAGAIEVMITAEDVVAFVARAAATIARHEALLDRLDAALGDGDHGTNMTTGLQAVVRRSRTGPRGGGRAP